jgi:hypothetical protein
VSRYIANALHLKKRHISILCQGLTALTLAFLVVLLNVLAVAPKLHKCLHTDSHSTQHQCAVTLFAQGQADSVAADIHPVIADGFIELIPPTTISVYRPAIENLPAGRAPPVSSSNS